MVERTEPLLPEDRMSKRSLDDMKRAIGESNGNADVRRPACAPERMLRIFSNDAVEGSGIVPISSVGSCGKRFQNGHSTIVELRTINIAPDLGLW